VGPSAGSIQAHSIRERQWEPLINQEYTTALLSGVFTPTPSHLLNADVNEDTQAVTTLWATFVHCYPNIEIEGLQATLNAAKGGWVVTAKPEIRAT